MGRLFGTDGVRGVANEKLTSQLAYELGKAGTCVLGKNGKSPLIVIGKDTRISGDMLESALCAGIFAAGGQVIKAGVIPTPAVAYAVRHFNADAGVVISASHNPYEYNGIKFFNSEGYKLDDAIEEEIEDMILDGAGAQPARTGEYIGHMAQTAEDPQDAYREFLLSVADLDLTGRKIVLDCANGASYSIAPQVFEALGADVSVTGSSPDGININDDCGSTHPDNLCREVVAQGAFMGLAFDGDADRLIAVDDKGNVIDGDRVIAICASHMKSMGQLKNDRVTVTVMSNLGFHKYMEACSCDVEIAGVGDRYVIERMLQTDCVLGGEQSGHIIFHDHTTTGDGILSGIKFLEAVLASGRMPSELAEDIIIYPQVLVNAPVSEEGREHFMEDDVIQAAIAAAESELAGDGRVLIRASGTEPLVRVMIEGSDIDKIQDMAEELAAMMTDRLGE